MNIFLLSIRDSNVDAFLDGMKRWEFRANPQFGVGSDHSLVPGDAVFMVGHSNDSTTSAHVRCMGVVKSILRGAEFRTAFGNLQSELWDKSGWHNGAHISRSDYQEHVLSSYTVAIEFDPFRLDSAIPVTDIRHRLTGKPWKGIGFVPATSLRRYDIKGEEIASFFRKLAEWLVSEVTGADIPVKE